MMSAETGELSLNDLLAALKSTQETKAKVRLSERNLIELVSKLKQLGFVGDDLLHTINGKEFITTDRLKSDIWQALSHAGTVQRTVFQCFSMPQAAP